MAGILLISLDQHVTEHGEVAVFHVIDCGNSPSESVTATSRPRPLTFNYTPRVLAAPDFLVIDFNYSCAADHCKRDRFLEH